MIPQQWRDGGGVLQRLPRVLRDDAGWGEFDWLLKKKEEKNPRQSLSFQWLFYAEQAAHVGHKLLQALEEGDLLLAVHGGWRAAGRQLVEGVGQPLVDDGVPLRREEGLHQLRVLRLTEDRQNI